MQVAKIPEVDEVDVYGPAQRPRVRKEGTGLRNEGTGVLIDRTGPGMFKTPAEDPAILRETLVLEPMAHTSLPCTILSPCALCLPMLN